MNFNKKYPEYSLLRNKAKNKIPRFIFDYLDGGCFADVGLEENNKAYKRFKLSPRYLKDFDQASLSVNLFGKEYSAPFGVAPIGLQGLIWPDAPKILAKSAKKHNIPYILSTVSSESLEVIADIAEDNAWYQLYNPVSESIQNSIFDRLKACGYENLVVTIDVPTFGFRPSDIVNGLSMPPQHSIKNFIEAAIRPSWSVLTLKHGIPKFKNLEPYMKDNHLDHKEMMKAMAMGKVNLETLKTIRDKWKGNLIIKGVCSEADFLDIESLGADGVIISNHGARQLDSCEPSIDVIQRLPINSKMEVMIDSGISSGSDIAIALANGAKFSFLGRFFMYSVAALGDEGGEHAIELLKHQLTQVMHQVRCEKTSELYQVLPNDIK